MPGKNLLGDCSGTSGYCDEEYEIGSHSCMDYVSDSESQIAAVTLTVSWTGSASSPGGEICPGGASGSVDAVFSRTFTRVPADQEAGPTEFNLLRCPGCCNEARDVLLNGTSFLLQNIVEAFECDWCQGPDSEPVYQDVQLTGSVGLSWDYCLKKLYVVISGSRFIYSAPSGVCNEMANCNGGINGYALIDLDNLNELIGMTFEVIKNAPCSSSVSGGSVSSTFRVTATFE